MFVDRGSFGHIRGEYFFELTVGASEIEVFRNTDRGRRIDTIPYNGSTPDPRRDMARLAAVWINDHGQVRRAG